MKVIVRLCEFPQGRFPQSQFADQAHLGPEGCRADTRQLPRHIRLVMLTIFRPGETLLPVLSFILENGH